MSTGPAIGIDLGTTFSCVGVVKNDRVEIIANDQGNRTTPSYVAFTAKERLIGEAAKKQAVVNPTNTVFDVKRLIGRRYEDEEVQDDMKRWPFKVINAGKIPKIEVQHCGKTEHFIAEQISSMVLSKMKETAEAYLDEKVTNAVITVPAYFNVNQRQATVDAGKLAGLNVLRIISEPTAAAIAYGMDRSIVGPRNVLIFDWGGGTFDVSIMSIENGKLEVKAVGGDTHLGGEDITSRLVDHFVEIFKEEHKGKHLTTNQKAISRLRENCEEVKRTLSSAENADLEIASLFNGIDFSASLTRARLEQLCSDLFNRTMDAVKTALSDAKMTKADVHEILLVGGSTRIPKVAKMLQDFFEGKEVKRSINADEAVAYGAANLASKLTGVVSNKTKDLVLLEVTPLSLGFEVEGNIMSTVIKRNTPIPTKKTTFCINSSDNQTEARFRVLEGERVRMCDNHLLGEFTLTGLPPRLRDENIYEVTFEIDENGILHVSAVERSTGKQKGIMITHCSGRLSEEEIGKMLKDAEKFKQEDEKERCRVAAKNELVGYVYRIKRELERAEVKQNHKEMLALCERTIKWTDTEKQATKEDYKQKREEIESVYSFTMKLQQLDS
ncbi:unnamed protein product [Taenia asiatica]|uniref:Heat shock protein 70 family n=1 Tax=Taenia asiatica TaxID=60517 RepID=A0A0R3VXT2_TAEAS|nr:unnamed protein product [Taenia asiatica]